MQEEDQAFIKARKFFFKYENESDYQRLQDNLDVLNAKVYSFPKISPNIQTISWKNARSWKSVTKELRLLNIKVYKPSEFIFPAAMPSSPECNVSTLEIPKLIRRTHKISDT